MCITQFNVHKVSLPSTRNTLFLSHTLNMFQHTQTNTHRAQLEVYVCWARARGSSMKGPIYTTRLGDARSRSDRLCVRPSHIARPILRGYFYSSPLIVTSVSHSLCLSFKSSYRLLFQVSVRPSTSTKLRELPLTLSQYVGADESVSVK